ncbi:hypothetical protein F2Q68_00045761 [Brassica cretica]|uniref:Uncharacterized protein n=1 Tax=Brassica cretica TaxID=69181 RepID=A0A8S9LTN2_BRACR|nr:hypothetical protein F2Q68_00045761 [Brassica cretica]
MGAGLDGQSCSCLIDGWPVGSFISNPGCWTVDRSCSCLIVGRLVDHMFRTVRGCYKYGSTNHRAAGRKGEIHVVKKLNASYGGIMAAMDNQGNMSFHVADKSGYLDLMKLLARPLHLYSLLEIMHVTPPS